jgi:uncharacterized DUF497 family protein
MNDRAGIAVVFEFDPVKSQSNNEKHGINFHEAQALWQDERLLRIDARTEGEARYVFIGAINGQHWSAVAAYRGDAVRLISVRRARRKEVALYENE